MAEHQKEPGRGSPPPTPRWVKLFVIAFILVIVLVVVLHLLGFGFGGHGLNSPGAGLFIGTGLFAL